jgi:hypothetical protein
MPTIRIWHGPQVIQVVSVSTSGSSTSGAVGGAEDSTKVDIELDPWAGLIVDNHDGGTPVSFRESAE